MPPFILFSLFLRCFIQHPKQWDSAYHTLHPLRATSPESLPPIMPTLGWLLCFPFKFWPLKAKAPFCLYFLTCVDLHPPNKSPNSGATKPDHGHLAWDHRRPRRHVLWAPLTYPWREKATLLEGRAEAAHFGWLLCLCLVFCDVFEWTFSYRRGRKLISAKSKMANFCAFIT
jgi:hypothetical protein